MVGRTASGYEGVSKLMGPGKLVLASSPLAKPDSRIHGAAEKKWVLVDASEIPQGVIEELNQAVAAARASS